MLKVCVVAEQATRSKGAYSDHRSNRILCSAFSCNYKSPRLLCFASNRSWDLGMLPREGEIVTQSFVMFVKIIDVFCERMRPEYASHKFPRLCMQL